MVFAWMLLACHAPIQTNLSTNMSRTWRTSAPPVMVTHALPSRHCCSSMSDWKTHSNASAQSWLIANLIACGCCTDLVLAMAAPDGGAKWRLHRSPGHQYDGGSLGPHASARAAVELAESLRSR